MSPRGLSAAVWRKSSRSTASSNCVEVAFVGDVWQKSNRSSANSNCVEVAWQKSSRSANTANWVEVARRDAVVGVRDSKDRGGGVLVFSAARWADFVGGLMRVRA
ncbi:DUF397 domain-containing protein [Saccharopolyspora shandongensis]|uniref:DUF397 domain-containing protein n=1 Tax=Saccharopolyspora shandongensis TaxID=418495 RepID=UPI000B874253|nr:DUF397 domain-containing protein [Saccharopolyspora shandongensis]